MKKILYIIPILVFTMVALTEDAKAQSGQVGNASNAITIAATTTVATNALIATNDGGGGGEVGGGTVTGGAPSAAPAAAPSQPASAGGGQGLSSSDVSTPSDPSFSFTVEGGGGTIVIAPGAPAILSFGGFEAGAPTTASAPDAVTLS